MPWTPAEASTWPASMRSITSGGRPSVIRVTLRCRKGSLRSSGRTFFRVSGPARRAASASSRTWRATPLGSSVWWISTAAACFQATATSPSEKDAVVTASVPPSTIISEGGSTKARKLPPAVMATRITPAAAASPTSVATSSPPRSRTLRPGAVGPGGGRAAARVAPRAALGAGRVGAGHQPRSDLMISVMVTPSRSSTTTTSPRATRRLFT
ncbi:hypothetical protein ACIU1J_26745 [Azospirillum doebereinerae]|uniref:hypothetical protein n=1 Tax=Azospirillum doebereinerae TaxID=92933 RepID=UPI00384F18DD